MLKKILTMSARVSVTLLVVALAVFLGWRFWRHYMESPWTRDGRVRAMIVAVAPDVSGVITELRVRDNQQVRKGDTLFVIDSARYQLAVSQAEAAVAMRRADMEQRHRELERRRQLVSVSVITQEALEQAESGDTSAAAALKEALVALDLARLNLERTQVRSPVNGHVANLQIDLGDYASAGKSMLAVVNSDSYYVAGYFEETKIRHIREGAPVSIRLMGHPQELRGRVESIAPAVADRENSPGTDLVANVNPTFSWVRLAQRIPVRVSIDRMPDGMRIHAGMTATVVVEGNEQGKRSL
ncbi:efflux RND transporter periplasmic adaptor subunit [Opitutaceae bacterium TAV4]|nr:efflux RND transporter periplasmic adaptor subunit [Opitutaceae bacterium TAV4]RRK02545.1 efflux RND transporter periplasmic adaptor subunit [Opitutaceae bacterium TAV3]